MTTPSQVSELAVSPVFPPSPQALGAISRIPEPGHPTGGGWNAKTRCDAAGFTRNRCCRSDQSPAAQIAYGTSRYRAPVSALDLAIGTSRHYLGARFATDLAGRGSVCISALIRMGTARCVPPSSGPLRVEQTASTPARLAAHGPRSPSPSGVGVQSTGVAAPRPHPRHALGGQPSPRGSPAPLRPALRRPASCPG